MELGAVGRCTEELANLTMSAVVFLVALSFTALLIDMPEAVLGAIVGNAAADRRRAPD